MLEDSETEKKAMQAHILTLEENEKTNQDREDKTTLLLVKVADLEATLKSKDVQIARLTAKREQAVEKEGPLEMSDLRSDIS